MNAPRRYLGIDFEYGNNTKGSICAYGLAFEDGTKEHGFVQLPAIAPRQEHTRFHGITQEQSDGGMEFSQLYARVAGLLAEAQADGVELILVAHDITSDRRAWQAAQLIHGLEALHLSWLNSLPIAYAELGIKKGQGKAGVATMAERYGIPINHHDPADDALIALQVVLRNPLSKNIIRDNQPAQRVKEIRTHG